MPRSSPADASSVSNSAGLYGIPAPPGDAYAKYVQDLSSRQLRILLDAYLAGDGHLGSRVEYGSSSERLAGDIRLICLKLGWCVTLRRMDRPDNWRKRPRQCGRINRKHLRPWWEKGKSRAYASLREEMVPSAGQVHGLTVPDGLVRLLRGDETYGACDGGRQGRPAQPSRHDIALGRARPRATSAAIRGSIRTLARPGDLARTRR